MEFHKEIEFQEDAKIGKIPKGWQSAKLGDYAILKGRIGWRGLKSSEYTEEGPFLIANVHIPNNKVEWDKCDHVSNFRYEESPEIQLEANDVIMSKDGTIGQVAFIEELPGEATVNSTMLLMRSKNKNLYPMYLYYYLQGFQFKKFLNQKTAGGQIPHIFQRDMKNLLLPLPTRVEQLKIASMLSKVDEAIQKTDEIIQKTKLLKKGLMQELLTKGIGHKEFKYSDELGCEIPKEWEVVRINKLCKVRRGASPRPIGDPSYFSESGRGWIRISDVTNTYKYLRKTSQYLSKKGEAKSVKVNPGDLIMSICATIGKAIILDMEACIHDGFVWFCDLSEKVDKEYLFYVLQRNEKKFVSMKQTGTQGNLNTTLVGKTYIPIPKKEEQHQMASILSKVDKQIEKERKTKERLEKLKKSLMQILLTGKVRIKVN